MSLLDLGYSLTNGSCQFSTSLHTNWALFMLKSSCLSLVISMVWICSHSSAQFVDQVAPITPLQNDNVQTDGPPPLEIGPGTRVLIRTKLGVVIRGELQTLTSEQAMIVTDRIRLKNPEGLPYKFTAIRSLSLPDHELHWKQGEDSLAFLKEVSESESLVFKNLVEFKAAMAQSSDEEDEMTGDGATTANNNTGEPSKVIKMQPASIQPIQPLAKPTITIICGNCEKEVALSSDSGQECPHCNILWDSSPLDAAELAALKEKEEQAKRAMLGSGNGEFTSEQAGLETNPDANNGFAMNANLNNADGNVNAASNNGLPQPVSVPAPIQYKTQPQEITLKTLPLWLKVAVFGVCMGALYYAVFVR